MSQQPTTLPLTGKKVFVYFLFFFLFIIAVNSVMVTLAVKTHTGIVTEHPYEKGLAYNKVIEAEQKQEALGWNSNIEYKNGSLFFTLHDKNGTIIKPEKTIATITRPTQAGMDFSVELTGGTANIAFPAKGLWEIRVDSYYQNNNYQKIKRIVVE